MGKYFLAGTVAFVVIIVGMLVYPTVHSNIMGIDVTGFTDLEKGSMAILGYAFLFFMAYVVWVHIKR